MQRQLWIIALFMIVFVALTSCRGENAAPAAPPVEQGVTQAPAQPAQPDGETQPPATAQEPLPGQAAAMLAEAQADLVALKDAPRYAIQLEIDPAGHTFSGAMEAAITNTESEPLESLFFRLLPNGGKSYGNGRLSVRSAMLGGSPAETKLSLEDTILEVRLPAPLPPGGSAKVNFTFDGEVPLDFGETGYGIYNLSEGVMALSAFYPMLAVYDADGWNLDAPSYVGDSVFSDIGFFTVDVSAPADAVVVATGLETGTEEAEGRRTHHLVSGPAREFFIVLSPDFAVTSATVDGTKINSFYRPGQEDGGKEVLEAAMLSLREGNERFGAYPYAEMDLVSAPMANALGVEFPGIMLVSSEQYNEMDPVFIASVAAHEVGHQWWYNLVGNDVFEEPWLDEALCTYFSGQYFERVNGRGGYQGYREYLQGRVDKLRADGQDDIVTNDLAYFEQPDTAVIYGRVVYSKGALFYYTLRDEIGDEAFFAALQSYFQARRYQIATASDLLDAFEQSAGRELDELYQAWLYSAE